MKYSENGNRLIFKHLKKLMGKNRRRRGDELVEVVNEEGMVVRRKK